MKISKILKSSHFWLYLLCMFGGALIICLAHIGHHLNIISLDVSSYLLGMAAFCGSNLLFNLGSKILDSYKKQNEVNNGNL